MTGGAPAYWPAWAGGLALATVAVGHLWFVRRGLGVSGLFSNLVDARLLLEVERQDSALEADPSAWEAELLAATARAAAAAGVESAQLALAAPLPALDCSADALPAARAQPALPVTGAAQGKVIGALVFLASVAAGGAVGAALRGGWRLQLDPGPAFVRLFGAGPTGYLALVLGGVLVGAGTRMAGGCTSGHGLSGVAALQPGSALATAVFFGTAVAVSLALAWGLAP